MAKRKIAITVPVVLAAVALAWTFTVITRTGTRSPAAPETGRRPAPVAVEITRAARGPISRVLELSGEVTAGESLTVTTTREGPVAHFPWREGDRVGAGEILLEIDREAHRAEIRSAEAALAVARARLADLEAGSRPAEIGRALANVRRWEAVSQEAANNLARQERLFEGDFVSRESFDQAREKLAVSEAELDAAREALRLLREAPGETEKAVLAAAVEEAEARLELAGAHFAESVITAPFDCLVAKTHVRRGGIAAPRSPLVEIYNPDSLAVLFSVPEAEASRLMTGLRLAVTLDAFPGRVFSLPVTRVHPVLDPVTRTLAAEAALPDETGILPHMFARLALEIERAADAVLVPADAVLVNDRGERHVFVVEDGVARRRGVTVGIEHGGQVQVTRGVLPGEKVVVAGHQALRDGREVKVAGD